MLIINADDFGSTKLATERIMTCFRHGAVTSTSAMVFMEDSERAAEFAKESGLDVGLHLNFTQAFTGTRCNSRGRERQERVARFLTRHKLSQLVYHPGLQTDFQYVFRLQLDEFLLLFSKAPSHFDGHHHMHLCANMLLRRVVPKGEKIRRPFSFFPGQKSSINLLYRWLVNNWIRRTYRAVDFLFSLADCIEFEEFDRIAELAAVASVELETHPEEPGELAWLMGNGYAQFRGKVRLGTYDMLA
jgi:hypothetical protein